MTRLRVAVPLALLALVVAAPAPATAAIKTRIVPAQMIFEHGVGDDPTNCSAIGFIRWAAKPKWVATRVLWRTSRGIERWQAVRPPYDDAYRHTQKDYRVAPGNHWSAFSRSWRDSNKPTDCSDLHARAQTLYDHGSARVEQTFDPELVELSGLVTERACDEGGCRVVPVPGVSVSAAAGGQAPVQGTTGADGRWSVEVRAGRWKVIPAAQGIEFKPPSRRVVAKKKAVRNLNFKACRLKRPAASTTVRAAQQGSSCGPDGIDWRMARRLTPTTPADHYDRFGLPTEKYFDPSTWEMKLFVTEQGVPAPCNDGERWRWVLEPKDDVEEEPAPGCSTGAKVKRLGRYEATAIRERRVDGSWEAQEEVKLGPVEVTIDDIVIAGVGDSLASGEGNPPFYFEDCDRSTDSYQFRAALFVEQADPHTSVTFLHPACSGARLDHMWARTFRGTRGNTSLDPQLTQVAERVREAKRRTPKVHAALASVGVNDLAFGPVLAFCTRFAVERPKSKPTAACPNRPVKAKKGKDGFVREFVRDKQGRPLEYELNDLFAELQPGYADFMARVRTGFEGDGLNLDDPARVLLTQYPNFSHDGPALCDSRERPSGPFRPRWSRRTWGWVGGSGDRLSELIRNTSGLGYTVVPINQNLFHRFGYCVFDPVGASWFVGIAESQAKQGNLNGAFHPKAIAHARMAADTRATLCLALYANRFCEGRFSG